jgi:predicted lipase
MTPENYKSYALSAARAKLAYMSPDEVKKLWATSTTENTLEHLLFKSVPSQPRFYDNKETNAQVYIWKQDKTLHIVFRGTQEKYDVLVDLNILRSYLFPASDILVHSGFLKQFKSLEEHITAEITDDFDNIDTIHFSGHSLGGALATLAAAYYGEMHKNKIEILCHTIGSPRVGNKAFTKLFADNVKDEVRITNDKDPVPLIPMSFLYRHVSNSICINDQCSVESAIEDIPWYWRIVYFPFSINYKAPVHCHSCNLYIERLLRLAELQDIKVF